MHGQRITLFVMAIVCAAMPALAQYVDVWPSWLFPRGGRQHASQVYSSVVERVVAVTTNTASLPDAPAWYRSQRENIITDKTALKAVVPYYTHPTNDYNAHMGWLNAPTNRPGDYSWDQGYQGPMPPLTVAALCAIAKLPTNVFDYTPWRCLDGIGPFTNDASVGHPHGWDVTATGGTNFPAGRTNWYTSDYGWQAVRVITSNLLVRSVVLTGTGLGRYSIGESSVSESEALAALLADYASKSPTNVGVGSIGYRTWRDAYASYWAFWMEDGSIVFTSTRSTNAATPTANGFARTWDNYGGPVYVYDQQNLGYNTTGSWYSATNSIQTVGWQPITCTVTTGVVRFEIGSTNTLPDMAPTTNYEYGVTMQRQGERSSSESYGILHLDYGGVDGFKFK